MSIDFVETTQVDFELTSEEASDRIEVTLEDYRRGSTDFYTQDEYEVEKNRILEALKKRYADS